MSTMAGEQMGRIWALYEVRVAESISPWGLPTQVLVLWKKIKFPTSFPSVQSTLTHIAIYTYFYSTQDLTTVVEWFHEQRKE